MGCRAGRLWTDSTLVWCHGALCRALVGGDVYLGGILVAALTKLTVRALEVHGATAAPIKDMQIKTLTVLCGVARVADSKAKGNPGAFAVSAWAVLPSSVSVSQSFSSSRDRYHACPLSKAQPRGVLIRWCRVGGCCRMCWSG
jgi:hypothetical protein